MPEMQCLPLFENSNPKQYRFEATVKNGLYQRKTTPYDMELSNTLPYTTEKKGNQFTSKKRGAAN